MSLPKFSVNNPIIANLLMLAIIGAGLYSANTLVREMFPDYTPNQVMISTVYPGATPAEVEKGIAIKIEEQVKNLEGIEDLETVIGEGHTTTMVILRSDYKKLDQAVTDARDNVDAIPSDEFPTEAEETIVRRFEPKLPVIEASIYGNLNERATKKLGKRLRDDILALPDITDVELVGTLRDEISVEIKPEMLVRYGLSFIDVGQAIRGANLDLPGGTLKTADANVAVRTMGETDEAERIADTVVRSFPDGRVVRIRDIAEVIDGFEDTQIYSRIDGKPAATVIVFEGDNEDAIRTSERVRALVAGKQSQPLDSQDLDPDTISRDAKEIYEQALMDPYPEVGENSHIKTHTNLANFITSRLDLLKRNGFFGLTLVFISLLIFLNWRIAFWVMVGLVLAILGTLTIMQVIGLTLNLITMFGLIVVLGLLVDDAIIVAEHTWTKIEEGLLPHDAAIVGAEEVTSPVTVAIITTIMAFAPLLFIKGQFGAFMGVLPWVVCCALAFSLFEALTILPSHMAEWIKPIKKNDNEPGSGRLARFREWRQRFFHETVYDNYARFLRKAVSWRYVTMSVAVGCLIIAISASISGYVPIVAIQKMDSDMIVGTIKMPVGTPADKTNEIVKYIENEILDLEELETCIALVGVVVDMQGGEPSNNSHYGQVIIELVPAAERNRSSDELLNHLREKVTTLSGVNSIHFSAMEGGPGGEAIDIDVRGKDIDQLLEATEFFKNRLREYKGVFDIADDFDAGRRELQIELLDSARALGLTTQSLAMQVRAAFYGYEVRKVQRDREDVKIMVRYPEENRKHIFEVERMWIGTPSGQLVPFTEVARVTEGIGYATIKRTNQQRTVAVTADVDQNVANAREILAEIKAEFPAIMEKYPGITIEIGGQEKEFAKAFSSLHRDFLIAVMLIYAILAGLFKSYIQPMIVMTAIPFGIIGAIAGHWVMGYPMTILSFIGVVALTGIVVNDSLILVDFINRRVRDGMPLMEAVIAGGRSRVRAIMLTSITTILGLAPLMLETSWQAKFLIPMGISITFGLAFGTLLTLVVVPCLYAIINDVRYLIRIINPLEAVMGTPHEEKIERIDE